MVDPKGDNGPTPRPPIWIPPTWALWVFTGAAVGVVVGAILMRTGWGWLVAVSYVITTTTLWMRRRDANHPS